MNGLSSQNVQSSADIEEAEYVQMRKKLQSALRMPSENRWIAEWLFLNNKEPFHKNVCLPPESFQQAHAFRMSHKFCLPGALCTPSSNKTEGNPAPDDSLKFIKDDNLLLIPFASMDGFSVGYSFMEGFVSFHGLSEVFPSQESGRFVFDRQNREFLMVLRGMRIAVEGKVQPITALMNVKWFAKNHRKHAFLACPDGDYDFYNLPHRVLSMCDTTLKQSEQPEDEFSDLLDSLIAGDMETSDTGVVSKFFYDNAIANTGDDYSFLPDISLFEDLLSPSDAQNGTIPLASSLDVPDFGMDVDAHVKSHLPWVLADGGGTTDGVGIPRRPGKSGTGSGAFNMGGLSDALEGIQCSLRGDYYGSKMREDFIHPVTGSIISGLSGGVIAKWDTLGRDVSDKLQTKAIQAYYSSVLSVPPESLALIAAAMAQPPLTQPLAAKTTAGRVNVSGQQMAPAALAPRPGGSGREESEPNGDKQAGDGDTDKQTRAESILQARRRRNRMSAARSNAKRRRMWQVQKETLAELRERVDELTTRKQRLDAENAKLRKKVELM